MRALILCPLIIVLASTTGCNPNISPGPDVQHATEVTFEQLKSVVEGTPLFYWTGSDDKYHYFKMDDGFYRLSTDFKMPNFERMMMRKLEPGSFLIDVEVVDGERILSYSRFGKK